MKIYTPILKNFLDAVPDTQTLKKIITDHAFEVEEVTEGLYGDVIDLKVLPDRAHDALSHRGIAREIATHTNATYSDSINDVLVPDTSVASVPVRVESPLCTRYMAVRITGVKITESSTWLKEAFLALGMRSINTLVDLTNYVLIERGQPLHVFDAKKVKGTIVVRMAHVGEKMTTLDDKYLTLDESMLVIADDEAVLALAGVKGGKKAEVDAHTTEVILECASFDSISVRKTAFKTGIRTDASKRFENNYPSAWADEALARYVTLLKCEQLEIIHSAVTDVYTNPRTPFIIDVSIARVNSLLGTSLTQKDVTDILTKLHLAFTLKTDDVCAVMCGDNLFNIREEEDKKYTAYAIIGHIARVLGYEKGIPKKDYIALKEKGLVAHFIHESDRIRNELVARGFVEVRTYHFQNEGVEELENPIANDKKFIRESLFEGLNGCLIGNLLNAPLLGKTTVSIFEIGTIITRNNVEEVHLAITRPADKKAINLKNVLHEVLPNCKIVNEYNEWFIEVYIADHSDLPVADSEPVSLMHSVENVAWQSLSPYPFATRDIAFFVSDEVKQKELRDIIFLWAGALCVRVDMFDEFEKKVEDGNLKLSRAYRLVFQSNEKTLTDEEVNSVMQNVETEIRALGCEVR